MSRLFSISNAGMREAFCFMLGELGIRAVGADASAMLSQHIWREQPRLIFADAELFARDNDAVGLRSYLARKEGVTAIACAQPDGLGLVFQALRRGADDYLIKPFDRAILKAKLTCLGFC